MHYGRRTHGDRKPVCGGRGRWTPVVKRVTCASCLSMLRPVPAGGSDTEPEPAPRPMTREQMISNLDGVAGFLRGRAAEVEPVMGEDDENEYEPMAVWVDEVIAALRAPRTVGVSPTLTDWIAEKRERAGRTFLAIAGDAQVGLLNELESWLLDRWLAFPAHEPPVNDAPSDTEPGQGAPPSPEDRREELAASWDTNGKRWAWIRSAILGAREYVEAHDGEDAAYHVETLETLVEVLRPFVGLTQPVKAAVEYADAHLLPLRTRELPYHVEAARAALDAEHSRLTGDKGWADEYAAIAAARADDASFHALAAHEYARQARRSADLTPEPPAGGSADFPPMLDYAEAVEAEDLAAHAEMLNALDVDSPIPYVLLDQEDDATLEALAEWAEEMQAA